MLKTVKVIDKLARRKERLCQKSGKGYGILEEKKKFW